MAILVAMEDQEAEEVVVVVPPTTIMVVPAYNLQAKAMTEEGHL